jgi:hypothetical protein
MIFRDLIQPEEFYDGCEVYETENEDRIVELSQNTHSYDTDVYIWKTCNGTYTNTGLLYLPECDNYWWVKRIICNTKLRICPVKYKPLCYFAM